MSLQPKIVVFYQQFLDVLLLKKVKLFIKTNAEKKNVVDRKSCNALFVNLRN